MRHLTYAFLLALLVPALAPAPAAAQGRARFTIAVNGGYQPSTTEFDDRFTFTLHQETGTTRTTYPVDAGPVFDGGVAVRLWGGLGAGVVVARFARDGAVRATSSVPHPLFLQRPREVSGETDGMRREETAVHVQAQYQLPPFGRLQIVLAGGPSVIDLKQSVVTDVNFTEEYPYDTATYVGVDSRLVTATAKGFNASADLRWMFTKRLGAGAVLRFTHAPIDLRVDDRTIRVDAGGPQIGVGLRLAF